MCVFVDIHVNYAGSGSKIQFRNKYILDFINKQLFIIQTSEPSIFSSFILFMCTLCDLENSFDSINVSK